MSIILGSMSTNLGKQGLAKFAKFTKLRLNHCYSVRYPPKRGRKFTIRKSLKPLIISQIWELCNFASCKVVYFFSKRIRNLSTILGKETIQLTFIKFANAANGECKDGCFLRHRLLAPCCWQEEKKETQCIASHRIVITSVFTTIFLSLT